MPAEAGIPNEFQFVAGLGRNLTAATLAESLEGYAHAIVPVSELSEMALWYLHKGLYSFTSVMSREVAALTWAVEQRPSSDPSSTLSCPLSRRRTFTTRASRPLYPAPGRW